MAMRSCRECGREVSSNAKSCPHCGIKDPGRTGVELVIMKVVAPILLVVFVFYWIASAFDEAEQYVRDQAQATAPTAGERYVYGAANVRAGPGTEHDVVSQLVPGDKVLIGSAEGIWTQLSDGRGYVYTSLLRDWPMAPSFEEIRRRMRDATEAQFNQFRRQVEGHGVDWTGWVDEVNEKMTGGYEVWIDMDPPHAFSVQDVVFDVPGGLALRLQKDQRVRFIGMIRSVMNVLETTQVRLANGQIVE